MAYALSFPQNKHSDCGHREVLGTMQRSIITRWKDSALETGYPSAGRDGTCAHTPWVQLGSFQLMGTWILLPDRLGMGGPR